MGLASSKIDNFKLDGLSSGITVDLVAEISSKYRTLLVDDNNNFYVVEGTYGSTSIDLVKYDVKGNKTIIYSAPVATENISNVVLYDSNFIFYDGIVDKFVKIDMSGNKTWETPLGYNANIYDIVVDTVNGDIYACENTYLHKLNSDGSLTLQVYSGTSLTSIALDENYIYLADYGTDKLKKISKSDYSLNWEVNITDCRVLHNWNSEYLLGMNSSTSSFSMRKISKNDGAQLTFLSEYANQQEKRESAIHENYFIYASVYGVKSINLEDIGNSVLISPFCIAYAGAVQNVAFNGKYLGLFNTQNNLLIFKVSGV